MLMQRTGLLVDYENANKSLDKAKPLKKQAVSLNMLFSVCLYIIKSDYVPPPPFYSVLSIFIYLFLFALQKISAIPNFFVQKNNFKNLVKRIFYVLADFHFSLIILTKSLHPT